MIGAWNPVKQTVAAIRSPENERRDQPKRIRMLRNLEQTFCPGLPL